VTADQEPTIEGVEEFGDPADGRRLGGRFGGDARLAADADVSFSCN
jgi:hypothetical protein